MNGKIHEDLKMLTQQLNETIQSLHADAIQTVSLPLDDIKANIQKTIDNKLKNHIFGLVKKLRTDEALSDQELQIIEKWMIGDAEFYTRIENNLIDWIGECNRLVEILSHYADNTELENDENQLFALGALLTDLKFTLSDVIRYTQAMNQVDYFKSILTGVPLNKESRLTIASMIEQKLSAV